MATERSAIQFFPKETLRHSTQIYHGYDPELRNTSVETINERDEMQLSDVTHGPKTISMLDSNCAINDVQPHIAWVRCVHELVIANTIRSEEGCCRNNGITTVT